MFDFLNKKQSFIINSYKKKIINERKAHILSQDNMLTFPVCCQSLSIARFSIFSLKTYKLI